MAIAYRHAVDVARGPEAAFAVLDDVTRTPEWLAVCKEAAPLSPGPNAVGAPLRYTYEQGGRLGVMEGETTARVPNEHVAYRYQDPMMDVAVDFRLCATPSGSRLVHTIEITPKSFMAKLFSSVIRQRLPKQTIDALERLRALLEADGA